MSTTFRSAIFKLVCGVIDLIETPHDDPLYYERARGLLAACTVALHAIPPADSEARSSAEGVPARGDLGPRIARLAFDGNGVRQIARILSVAPSTVSRTLRRQQGGRDQRMTLRANLLEGAEGAETGADAL